MKNKKIFDAFLLTILGSAMSLSLAGVLNSNHSDAVKPVLAEATEKTYFDRSYTSAAAKDYTDESQVSELGFYAGHLLRTNKTLCNISGKSSNGPYWVIKVDAADGNYLTDLKLSATGRFYYSSGQNDPREQFYISTDSTNFGDMVSSTRCEYGEYNLRTTLDIDLTPYIPYKASTVYVKWLLGCSNSSYGWSYDWTKFDTIKVTGKEVAQDSYTGNKNFSRVIEDNFKTTPLSKSNAFYYENVDGRANATHVLVPGFWDKPTVVKDVPSQLTYMIPTAGQELTELKLDLNAKIWNQNNTTCHEKNKINVYAGKTEKDFTLIKSLGCVESGGENLFKDFNIDISNFAKGLKNVFVKIELVQSDAAGTSPDPVTQKINGVVHDAFKFTSLNNVGVKIANIKFTVKGDYVCPPGAEKVAISKDFSATGTDTLEDAVSVTGWQTGNPEGSYVGMYNPGISSAKTASIVYKVNATEENGLISGVKFKFTDSRYAYYSGTHPSRLKLYVSSDNQNFVEAAELLAAANVTTATLDASYEARILHSKEVYVKIEHSPRDAGCGSTNSWVVLSKIQLLVTETVHPFITEHVDADCLNDGYHKLTCPECGLVLNTVLSAAGHNPTHYAAVAKTCTTDGNIEYWQCEDCEKYFTDASCTQEVEATDVVIPASHELMHTAAVAKSCTTEGNIEYWQCAECDKYFADAEGTQEITLKDTVVPASHEIEHVEAKAKTCTNNGNYEYWHCTECDKYYSDAECRTQITLASTVIPAGHDLEHVAKVNATCEEDGVVEHWHCTLCGKDYLDADAKLEIEAEDLVVEAKHNLKHVAAKEATCTEKGNVEYWLCTKCGKYFADAEGTQELSLSEVFINASHTLEHVAAKDATCEENGNIEYWYCSVCGKYFANAEGTKEIKLENTVIEAKHSLVFVAMVSATTEAPGVKAHYECEDCDDLFVRDELGNFVKVELEALQIPQLEASEKGCEGSILAASGIVSLVTFLGLGLVSKKRREE